MMKVVPTIYKHFQVSVPQKEKSFVCIIAIMDNSKDLKKHRECRLNERVNQALQIHSYVLVSFFLSIYLILKNIVSFSFSLLYSGCTNILLIDQSVQSESRREEKKKRIDDHSREIEHLSVKGHCPIEI